ncbi:MAG: hypothetical protein ACJAS3_003101 [Roseivirga sp.]|jgi:hypothetical protein
MDTITIDKIIAILVTGFFIYRNTERTSNYVGGLLILTFGLTLLNIGILTTISVILYLLTVVTTIWLVLTHRIKTDIQTLISIFLIGIITKGVPLLLNFPNYAIFFYLSFALVLLYLYFILFKKSANILVITTVPVMDCVITLDLF